ncbi:MAG: CheR family methyltransferase, partial [Rubrivivax sp.]|nr:CheR family methyltransferase [Rubrivivax sp.]
MQPPDAGAVLLQRLQQHQGMRPDPVLQQRVQQALDDIASERRQAAPAPATADLSTLAPGQPGWQNFLDRVLVPETWFRRDAGALAALAAKLGAAPRPAQRLRVLCAPCSTGEEPLSVALLLRDLGWPDDAFSVHGIDLSQTSIAAARGGHYRSHAFRGVDPVWRERHFMPCAEAQRWQLRQPLPAASLQFEQVDVFALERPALPWDVVFCRNLLIYLEQAVRVRLLGHLRGLCRDDGLLFVGHAEVGLLHDAGLVALTTPMSFGYQNRLRTSVRQPARPAAASAPAPRSTPTPSRPVPL